MLFLLQQFEFEKFTSKLDYQPLNLKKTPFDTINLKYAENEFKGCKECKHNLDSKQLTSTFSIICT